MFPLNIYEFRDVDKDPEFFTNFFIGDKKFHFSVRDRMVYDWKNKHIKVNEFPVWGRYKLY